MNDTQTITATPIELRKIACRQSAKDWLVITFAVHPSDMPASLAAADIGTRFMAALVEIGDDEKPVEPKEREHKQWHEMQPAQQAGLLSNEPMFQRYLRETTDYTHTDYPLMVRQICGVMSRADILPETPAGEAWRKLVSDYRAWCGEPEVVG